uniref:Uncharacterized protein n=1 Tax=Arundo donax TaxID=35708 RepID=A0A0A9HDR4_ARUDO
MQNTTIPPRIHIEAHYHAEDRVHNCSAYR